MSHIYRRAEANEIFKNVAMVYDLIFHEDFDVNFLKYKGTFEDPNDDVDKTVRFDVLEDEITKDFITSTINLVKKTFSKGGQIMRVTDSILVSVDFDLKEGPDTAVLIVGKKKKGEAIDILNAFQGEEAIELWNKLTGSGKKEEK